MEQDARLKAFEAQIAKGFEGFSQCLVAVSGGADSMAMLGACHSLGLGVEVASIDHGLRPESGADVELVRSFCASRNIVFHARELKLEHGPGLEARAREARYAALMSIASARNLRWIATAHTASDQAETVLMRLFRGASPRGAVGIVSERTDGVIRPLLFAERHDTVAYVTARGIPFVSDPMNDDRSFLRSRLRHEVLPLLERVVGGHVPSALVRFSAFVAEDEELLSAEASNALARVRLGAELDLHSVRALSLPIQRRVLAAWLGEHGLPLDAHHLDDVRRAIAEGRTATLPKDQLLTNDGHRLRVEPAPPRLHGSSSGDDGRARK